MSVTQKEIVELLVNYAFTPCTKIDELIARIEREGIAPPDGWELVPSKEFHALWFWLDRCEDKGHLDNCYDLVQPLADFNKAMLAAAPKPAQEGET